MDPHAAKHHFYGALIAVWFVFILQDKRDLNLFYAAFVVFYATSIIIAISVAINNSFYPWQRKLIFYSFTVLVAVAVAIGIFYFEKKFEHTRTELWKLLFIVIITIGWLGAIELNNLSERFIERRFRNH